MRDRLIELMRQAEFAYLDFSKMHPYEKSLTDFTADSLLDNGVIVPPCKVGSKVYYFSQEPLCLSVQANTVYEAEVVMITTNRLGTSLVIQIRNEYGCTELPSIDKWGKTLFTTREEAEQALKGGVQE